MTKPFLAKRLRYPISCWLVILAMGATSCGPRSANTATPLPVARQLITLADPAVDATLDFDGETAHVMGPEAFQATPMAKRMAKVPEGLVVGLPIQALTKPYLFGGVVTEVADHKAENLGIMKLAAVVARTVVPMLEQREDGAEVLSLRECERPCPNLGVEVLGLPVVGRSEDGQLIYVDLARAGDRLDLMDKVDSMGIGTGFSTRSSRTTAVDYDADAFVFDVESDLVPSLASDLGSAFLKFLGAPQSNEKYKTTITARWYMIPAEKRLHPNFVVRAPRSDVGFFQRNVIGGKAVIERFATARDGATEPVHYFVKGVPVEYRSAFDEAFEGWNDLFEEDVGSPLLVWEHVGKDDPRFARLKTGDARYNVIEWDEVNRAPYGGMGPSVTDYTTGEVLSAHVLIQGPAILEALVKWWRAAGKPVPEYALDSVKEHAPEPAPPKAESLSLTAGEYLEFSIPATRPELHDELVEELVFRPAVEGETFESYIHGYLVDMIEHEVGHNLGLRHNFRGNHGADAEGHVTRSVMEYLGRTYRHKSRIGAYDHMAIAWGYTGREPEQHDWYCTDEQVYMVGDAKTSAECSPDDATADPFGYFAADLAHAAELIVPADPAAKSWTVTDMEADLSTALQGMLAYYEAAPREAQSWTNWRKGNDRPSEPAAIQAYVVRTLHDIACDPSLEKHLAAMPEGDARNERTKHLAEFRNQVSAKMGIMGAGYSLDCRD